MSLFERTKMLDYLAFRVKRAVLQFLCNFIPFQSGRIRARNAVYTKFLGDRVILCGKVDSHLPKAILAKINAYENEYFMEQNAKIAINITLANERERERESKWRNRR